jgi:hypothetical protein
MPCRDYEYDYSSHYRKQNDRLARIACKAMTELVKQGKADFLLLKDDEVREWWEKHLEADRKAKEEAAEKRRINKLKKEALAKLTPEEMKAPGIKTKS